MDRHKQIEAVHDNKLDTDWRENVNICAQYIKRQQKFLMTLDESQEMRDRRFGRIEMVKQRIKLIAASYTLSIPLGSTVDREHASLGRQKNTKWLYMISIDPALSKRASSI